MRRVVKKTKWVDDQAVAVVQRDPWKFWTVGRTDQWTDYSLPQNWHVVCSGGEQ